MLYTVLLVILMLLLLGALPTWPYSAGWGYYPSGGLGFGGNNSSHLIVSREFKPSVSEGFNKRVSY